MRKIILLITLVVTIMSSKAQERATPEEVIAKVHKAAELLKEKGDAALSILRDSKSEFTWKDTYIFLIDVGESMVLSNPAFREREGGNIREHKDWNQDPYGQWLCELALKGGGWMEFNWPQPGSQKGERKVSYIYPIPGLKYTVCAGVYGETRSIEELNNLTKMMTGVKSKEKSPIIVIFEVKPTKAGKDEYLKIAAELKEELSHAEGFISGERYESLVEQGKLLSVNVWESEEALAKWRNNHQHRQGQKRGHDTLFEKYNIKIAKIIRDYSLTEREQAPKDSNEYLK